MQVRLMCVYVCIYVCVCVCIYMCVGFALVRAVGMYADAFDVCVYVC